MTNRARTHDGNFSGLLTDFYELTMAAGYVETGLESRASFELFVRGLPPQRNFLVAAGLEQALDFLENLHFTAEEISYLRAAPSLRHLPPAVFERLERVRFTGDVWALPEGSFFFDGEPLLRVTAPLVEAQLVETNLLAICHLQTLIASKAARVVASAQGRGVIEFGARRAHGTEAGVLAARAAYLAGCEGSSNTYAGFRFGIPVFGTQAHSWIMAHRDEQTAFNHFLNVFPANSVLLVDTYDVRTAIDRIIATGRKPGGVRLDSGDIVSDSRWTRARLDGAGWNKVGIFLSGDLDERRIAEFLGAGGCANSFGVGTALATSSDAPSVGLIYKLVEIESEGRAHPTAKFSRQKKTYPGCKQVFRFPSEDGSFRCDVIGLEDESFPGGEPLLVQVMRNGERIAAAQTPAEALAAARRHFLQGRKRLPQPLWALEKASEPYPVRYSERLESLCEQVRRRITQAAPAGAGDSAARREAAPLPVFWAVDLQADFMRADGHLYVPGSEAIVPNVRRLVEASQHGRLPLVSSADAHRADDAEMSQWPSHCLLGTPGAELIPEARTAEYRVVPNRKGYALPPDFGGLRQLLLQKNTLDVFDNPNTEPVLARLHAAAAPHPLEFFVFGVATEYCVRVEVEGLLDRGYHVGLVTDAIRPLEAAAGRRIVEELVARGARTMTTEEAIARAAR